MSVVPLPSPQLSDFSPPAQFRLRPGQRVRHAWYGPGEVETVAATLFRHVDAEVATVVFDTDGARIEAIPAAQLEAEPIAADPVALEFHRALVGAFEVGAA